MSETKPDNNDDFKFFRPLCTKKKTKKKRVANNGYDTDVTVDLNNIASSISKSLPGRLAEFSDSCSDRASRPQKISQVKRIKKHTKCDRDAEQVTDNKSQSKTDSKMESDSDSDVQFDQLVKNDVIQQQLTSKSSEDNKTKKESKPKKSKGNRDKSSKKPDLNSQSTESDNSTYLLAPNKVKKKLIDKKGDKKSLVEKRKKGNNTVKNSSSSVSISSPEIPSKVRTDIGLSISKLSKAYRKKQLSKSETNQNATKKDSDDNKHDYVKISSSIKENSKSKNESKDDMSSDRQSKGNKIYSKDDISSDTDSDSDSEEESEDSVSKPVSSSIKQKPLRKQTKSKMDNRKHSGEYVSDSPVISSPTKKLTKSAKTTPPPAITLVPETQLTSSEESNASDSNMTQKKKLTKAQHSSKPDSGSSSGSSSDDSDSDAQDKSNLTQKTFNKNDESPRNLKSQEKGAKSASPQKPSPRKKLFNEEFSKFVENTDKRRQSEDLLSTSQIHKSPKKQDVKAVAQAASKDCSSIPVIPHGGVELETDSSSDEVLAIPSFSAKSSQGQKAINRVSKGSDSNIDSNSDSRSDPTSDSKSHTKSSNKNTKVNNKTKTGEAKTFTKIKDKQTTVESDSSSDEVSAIPPLSAKSSRVQKAVDRVPKGSDSSSDSGSDLTSDTKNHNKSSNKNTNVNNKTKTKTAEAKTFTKIKNKQTAEPPSKKSKTRSPEKSMKKSQTVQKKQMPATTSRKAPSVTSSDSEGEDLGISKRFEEELRKRQVSESQKPEIVESDGEADTLSNTVGQGGLFYEDINSKDTELWLIRAPVGVDIGKLNKKKILLDGSQSVGSLGEKDVSYEIQATRLHQMQAVNLLALFPSKTQNKLCAGPDIQGQINLVQSVLIPPIILPRVQPKFARAMPKGLKPRFQPFGAGSPVQYRQKSRKLTKLITLKKKPIIDGQEEKKKKKKKKHRDDGETDTGYSAAESSKGGKKKRKHQDQENAETDTGYSAVESSREGKKKRKHKHQDQETATEDVKQSTNDQNQSVDSLLEQTPRKKHKKHKRSLSVDSCYLTDFRTDHDSSKQSDEVNQSKKHKKKKKKKD